MSNTNDLDEKLYALDRELKQKRSELEEITQASRRQLVTAAAEVLETLDKESVPEMRTKMIECLEAARELADQIVDETNDVDTARSHSILAQRLTDILNPNE